MTAQIIFPKQDTYWILSDGASYFDGLTAANCVTTVGAGTQIYWIGTDYEEYINACLNIGLTPRNAGQSTITRLDPSSPISILEEKIKDLGSVIPGVRISARQARLWLIQNGVDLNIINSVIDTIEDAILRESIRTEWEYAPYIERSYPWLNSLASQLGLSESDLDRAFREGANI